MRIGEYLSGITLVIFVSYQGFIQALLLISVFYQGLSFMVVGHNLTYLERWPFQLGVYMGHISNYHLPNEVSFYSSKCLFFFFYMLPYGSRLFPAR